MEKADADESVPICQTVLLRLLAVSPTKGRPGSDLRTAVGDFLAYADYLIRYDLAGPPLQAIYDLARATGITFPKLEDVRSVAAAQTARTVGAALIRDSLVNFTLAAQGLVLADMIFVSRDDVDAAKLVVNSAFGPMEETMADAMDQQGYVGVVSLHAAIIAHLVKTARPLPRMLNFVFAQSSPTLVTAYRLYADASRADELRAENHVVHPAFELPAGRALSS
jgi:prophage DNA circulation protein